MKKALLAAAVVATLPAFAQAQSSVQLYGIADAAVSWVDGGGNKNSGGRVDSGVQSTSRLGFRGTEDLGGGLKGVFNLEMGYSQDTGCSNADSALNLGSGAGASALNCINVNGNSGTEGAGFFQRRAVVGVESGIGQVLLGRDYTSGFIAAGNTDVMGYGLWGNLLTYTAQANGIQTRASNGIHYISPTILGGLTIRGFYSFGAENERTAVSLNTPWGTTVSATLPKSSASGYGLSGFYNAGPFTAQAYWQQFRRVLELTPTQTLSAATSDISQYGIGGGFKFGIFRGVAGYYVSDPDNAGAQGKYDAWNLGLGIKLGPGELLGQYIALKQEWTTGDRKANVYGIAYTYPMSRRTNLYATWGQTSNNGNASFSVLASDTSVSAGGVGADPMAFSVGLRHQF